MKKMIVRIFLNKQEIEKYCEAKENFMENWMEYNCCQFDTNNTMKDYLICTFLKKYTKINDQSEDCMSLDQFSF